MRSALWLIALVGCGSVKGTPPDAPEGFSTLTVAVTGTGSVTSTPAGIDCPGTCSAAFAPGTEVTLSASASSPIVFTGWSSGCTPSRFDCTLTLDADIDVGAGFATQGSKLALMTAGAATGFSTGQSVTAFGTTFAVVGRVSVPTQVGGLTATGGMYITRVEAATASAMWVVNVANATGMEIVSDAEGNVIVAGHFDGMINLGNGNVMSNTNSTDWFVAKYAAADGTHLWSRVVGGSFFDFATALAIAPNGDIVVGGSFSRTVDFGNGTARTSTGVDTDDIFVARYAAADGAHLWSSVFGNADNEQLYGLIVDSTGSVGFTGTFTGNLSIGPNFLQSGTAADAMFGRIDGASGNVLFAKDLGGTGSDFGHRIVVDADDNLIVTGNYVAPTDLGGGALPAGGTQFIAKFTPAGSHVWSHGYAANINRLAVDSFGELVFAGSIQNKSDLGNGVSLVTNGGFDGFVAKLDVDGTTKWGKRFGGALNDAANGLALDQVDGIHVTGQFEGVADFDNETETAAGMQDLFVLSFAP